MPVIIFEGCDGAGKSLQAQRLANALGTRSLHPFNDSDVGQAVRGLLVAPRHTVTRRALILAASAELWRGTILPRACAGEWVVVDRGMLSYLAYEAAYDTAQHVASASDWLTATGAAGCDMLHVWLDPDPRIAHDRQADDGLRKSLSQLHAARVAYKRAVDAYPWAGIVTISSNGHAESVWAEVWDRVTWVWPELRR